MLGIDPRDHEFVRAKSLIKQHVRQNQDDNLLMQIKQSTFENNAPLITEVPDNQNSSNLKRKAHYEFEMERFSGHCFVLDPSMRAQGDS